MKIGQIVKFNKKQGGQVKDLGSLQFAMDYNTRNSIVKIAHVTRAIAVDHPFTDANKRTAHYTATRMGKQHGMQFDDERLAKNIHTIAKKNINNINNIRKRLYNAKK